MKKNHKKEDIEAALENPTKFDNDVRAEYLIIERKRIDVSNY